MLRISAGSTLALALTLIAAPAFAGAHHHGLHRISRHKHEPIGQRGIDSTRATQIQDALIRAKYLSGTASGKWDADTEAAMQKYQADHGWQTKLTPDSRALIALGLGPSTASSEALAVNAYKPMMPDAAEAGTLASVRSISQ